MQNENSLRNSRNNPVNSSTGVIEQQECVEPVCDDDSLKRVALEKKIEKPSTTVMLHFLTCPIRAHKMCFAEVKGVEHFRNKLLWRSLGVFTFLMTHYVYF